MKLHCEQGVISSILGEIVEDFFNMVSNVAIYFSLAGFCLLLVVLIFQLLSWVAELASVRADAFRSKMQIRRLARRSSPGGEDLTA